MKQFVYFFKHINVQGVKIGKTSGESVQQRFADFKIYSPFGATILGYYQAENALYEERALHQRFAAQRMNGEFFDITQADVENLLMEKVPNYSFIVSEFILHGITPNDVRVFIENRKSFSEDITSKRDKLINILRLLPLQFTAREAANACIKLGYNSRFFEICKRKKDFKDYVLQKEHGVYLKL